MNIFLSGHFCVNYVGEGGGVNTYLGLIKNFRAFHLGPALAFNLNKYGTSTMAREKAEFLLKYRFIDKNQPVLCAFGEIDCRVHVLRQAEKRGGDFRPVVDEIASCYLEFLKYLAREHQVYVWGAVPSQSDTSEINPNFPRYGTEIQRNLATEYFNGTMKNICNEHGFKFVSIFSSLIDSNYRTKREYIADGCHLSQKAWEFAIPEFMKHGINVEIISKESEKNAVYFRGANAGYSEYFRLVQDVKQSYGIML